MSFSSEQILGDSNYRLAYFAVLIVLVLLITYYAAKSVPAERMDIGASGAPVWSNLYDSGGVMRLGGTTFSGTNQEEYNTPRNRDVRAVAPLLSPEQEMLVNQGGYPDFWTITGELDAYKTQQTTAMSTDATADTSGSSEYFGTPVSNLMDTQLSSGFYPGASTF